MPEGLLLPLDEINEGQNQPSTIHICGVGLSENVESIIETLKVLKQKQFKIYWYCGRKYLDSYYPILKTVCEPIFIECESNTMAIYKHFRIRSDEKTTLFLTLARQFADPTIQRKEEHLYWHDLLAANASRYFKYEDRRSFITAIQKLAGLISRTDSDDEQVESYRSMGKYAVPIGDSKPIKKLRQMIQRLAPLNEPVLLLGPTGSGKEVAARLLHEASNRHGIFVPVNCAILSANNDLAHDRLFGHVAGAYTGAKDSQPGAFEIADKGTLFLDEIAELPLSTQTQLLRVLEEGTITPLGTMKSFSVDTRIIAATNQDLPVMIRSGHFRMDLYYRVNVLTLRVPSLQERQDDMKSIAKSVIYELKNKGYVLTLSPADWKSVYEYPWPGNIRQFINLLKRSAYLDIPVRVIIDEEVKNVSNSPEENLSKKLVAEHRVFYPCNPEEILPEEEIRKLYMQHVLKLLDGNISRTAEALQVAKNTLKKWINEP